ncbi:MAG: BTAD domain-containing putative transcriptional regulator [Anaerolineae bacterium]|nr:BTAD domain-containing putative transcriptional regulator [Anaerolineae bacterium]
MSATNALRITTLGRVAIERDGLAVTDLASRKAEALLIYLACTGRQHPREMLADLLWDDRSQRQAMANLRAVLSSLRKALGPYLAISRSTAAVDPDANLFLDTAQLEAAVSAAQSAQGIHATAAAEQLAAAIELYHGDFLAGFFVTEAAGFETWAAAERERLHRLALDGLQRLGRWYLSEGQYGEAMATSTRLLELDPLAEAGHRQLMEALARRGQRSEALAVYEGLEATLWRELGVEPSRATRELVEAIQADRLAVPRATLAVQAKPPIPLPAPATSLIGRETELEEIQSLFLEHGARLLTIVGPGGVGKTSLALEAARHLVDHFAGGAAFVSLAPLSSAEAIVPSLAQALQFKPEGAETRDAKVQLLDYLADKRLLLVLDNFEHLLGGAPLLTEILVAATQVKLLVTSRERLKLQTEHVYPLQGLPYAHKGTVEEARRSPAVQLFLQHGRRVRAGYEPQAEDIEALQQILRLVEGMPLAIILAASWLELLSPVEIAAEIERSLGFLEADYRDLPRRQRSMRAVFETTWARLDEREQTLFAALSIFRGGFTLAAAREVAGATPRDLLRLVGRSLLARDEEGRFAVHELLRQFATEQLARAPEGEAPVRDAHSAYYLALLCESESELKGAGAEAALEALAADADNFFAAWDRAVAQEQFARLEPAAFSLATFCELSARFEEGLGAFSRAIMSLREHVSRPATADPAEVATLIPLLAHQCTLLTTVGALKQVEALGEEALSLLERQELQDVDTRHERALVLLGLARGYSFQNRGAEAQPILQKSVSLFEAVRDTWYIAHAYHELAGVTQGRYKQAVPHVREAVRLFERLGDKGRAAEARVFLAFVLGCIGELEEAEQRLRNSIDPFLEMGDEVNVARVWNYLAMTVLFQGRFVEARALATQGVEAHEHLGRRRVLAMSNGIWCRAVLHLGDYEAVLGRVPAILNFAQANDLTSVSATGRFSAGCALLGQGQAGRAREELAEATYRWREVGERDLLCEALVAFSCACTLAADLPQAREALLEATRIAFELESPIFALPVLPAVALLMAVAAAQPEQAVELYALATRRPYVANSRWFEDVVGQHVKAAAFAVLAPEQIAIARNRGETLDLWETASEVLEHLEEMAP